MHKSRLYFALVTAAVLFVLAVWTINSKLRQELLDAKAVTTVEARITKKEHINFARPTTYTDYDGVPVQRMAGDEEFRLYYRFKTTGGDRKQEDLRTIEEQRSQSFGERFSIVKRECFELKSVGDQLTLHFRVVGSRVEVLQVMCV